MIRQILLIAGLFFSMQIFAQTGIGTTSPDASAKLHVESSNKGFLPPRVALTATNSASPIISPANGLMVFNTVTAGTNPYQVVPGYYYWDGTDAKWVSLSTTVGNVQNQAIFRSTANTNATSAVSTWDSKFNNIASGDLTITSGTNFALSNGIYKIQWGLPHQNTQSYNMMQLQEYTNSTWGYWGGNLNYASVANGGSTEWGGTTFMTDVIDCTSGTRTIRLYNPDSRTLYTGASFIITKLNPSITTSTTADNLGDHTATKNILLNGNYLSNDGGNEGIKIDNTGNVGIGTNSPNASAILDVSSSSKGILIPRLTASQKSAISSPTTGLLIFQTDAPSDFYYYNGSSWISLREPNWTSAGTIQSVGWNATTTAPTIGSTTINDYSYKQIGSKTWKCQLTFSAGSSSTGAYIGSGDYLFTLPNGLQFNTSIAGQAANSDNVGTSTWVWPGLWLSSSSGSITNLAQGGLLYVVPYSSTQFRLIHVGIAGIGFVMPYSSGYYAVGSNISWRVTFTFQSL